MIQHKWFRVEQDKDGSILSCTEVEAKGVKGGLVRFYSAVDAESACVAAYNWYAHHRLLRNVRRQKRVRAIKSAGMCVRMCRNPARPGLTVCQHCADKDVARARELRARRASGDNSDRRFVYASAEEAKNAIRQQSRETTGRRALKLGSHAARVYSAILRRLDRDGPIALRAWLVAKIPAMQQTQGEWHPPMVEPMAEAAE